MNAEICDYTSKFPICLKYQNSQQKEPITPRKVPKQPWQIVSTDLLQLGRHHYLLIVIHYSNFIDYTPLRETTSSHVVNCLKCLFSRFRIPEKVISTLIEKDQSTFSAMVNTKRNYVGQLWAPLFPLLWLKNMQDIEEQALATTVQTLTTHTTV